MASLHSFPARVDDGKLIGSLRALERMRRAVSHWRRCRVVVTVERAHATRSLAQNACYWGVVLQHLHDDIKQVPDDLHEYCKLRFNPRVIVVCDPDGVIVGEERVGASTTTLNKITFYEYVERVRMWMRDDLGITTPDPDPDRQQVA